MRKLLLGLVAVLLLAALAIALSIDRLAGAAIERSARAALGVDTHVGFVRLSLLAGEVKVSRLRIANPPGFPGEHFLTFQRFELKTDLATLRAPVVDVPRFLLEGIDVSLERQGERTNTDVILANLKRFESGRSASPEPEHKGPEQRFRVAQLAIRDVRAHVEWNSLASRASALDIHIDGVELAHPGGERGLTLPELSNLVVKAVLDSVRRSGKLPVEVANDLAGGLRGLTRLPFTLTGDVLDEAAKRLPGAAGDALGAVGGAVNELGNALDGVLGGKRDKKDER